MKMKKRISALIAILLVIAFAVSGTVVANIQASAYDIFFPEDMLQDEEFVAAMWEELINQYGEEYFDNLDQARANDANLMSYFARNRLGERMYPDFYGGVYYNEDGNMVLLIVEEATSTDTTQYNLVRNFTAAEDIIIEYVEFSYIEINAVMDTLDAMFFSNDRPEAFDNVTSHALDTKNNTIEVRLLVYNEDEITRFRETVLDSPVISFVESDGFGEFLTTIRPGHGISNTCTSSNNLSVGYRARVTRTGAEGFVTAAHTFATVNTVTGVVSITPGNVFRDGNTIGRVNENRAQFAGDVDAIFVYTRSDVNVLNTTPSGLQVRTAIQTDVRQGDQVGKHGMTTGWTTGRIVNTTASFSAGVSLVRLVEVENIGVGMHDSGGIVVWLARQGVSGPFGAGDTAGIVTGRQANGRMVFTRANKINYQLDLTSF